jgi:hypothetical protein
MIPGAVNFQVLTDSVREGGFWCGPHNPATYRWSINGDTLTPTPVGPDRCAGRTIIWSGD